MLYRDIRACGIKKKELKDLKVKSNAWKKVAEEMDSNAKYTVTFWALQQHIGLHCGPK